MRYRTGTCSIKNRNNDCKDYAERGDKDANLQRMWPGNKGQGQDRAMLILCAQN